MALVSSLPGYLQMERRPSGSSVSSVSLVSTVSSRSSLKEVVDDVDEDLPPRPARAPSSEASYAAYVDGGGASNKVFLAVEKEFKLGKANLIWVLKNTPRPRTVVIIHVHVPSQMIPLMGAWFPADQLKAQEVQAYRAMEKDKMERSLNEYLERCSTVKDVKAEKLVIEADEVGQGIVELIAQHKITNLVMGAAADKNYSKKLKEPRSKKALIVQEQADPSCKISFVCKGNLICTREPGCGGPGTKVVASPKQAERMSSRSSPQILGQLLNFLPTSAQEAFKLRSVSNNSDSHEEATMATQSSLPSSPGSKEGIVIDLWDGLSRSSRSSERSMRSVSDDVLSTSSSIRIIKDEEIEGRSSALPTMKESDEKQHYLSISHDIDDAGLEDELYKDLRHAVSEPKNLTREAYEESMRRKRAERDLHEASQKMKAAEDLYITEIKQRKEIEQRLSLEKVEMQELRKQRDEMFEEFQKAREQRITLEKQVADSNCIIKDLEKKLSEAHYLLISLQGEHVELRRERDEAIREAEHLRQKLEEAATSTNGKESFFEFAYSELEEATNKFDNSLKIGEGGYGSVYKGVLRERTVAIKLLNSQGMQGQKEFHKEVNVLSRLKHPNLVNLIGVCLEAWALVYDFLPSGSLEDRLTCKDYTPPLTWEVRIRIAAEICAALNFLHSNKCLGVVHGDLKPANILLDENFVSKLGDFGICRLVQSTNNTATLYRCTHAMGTFVYMDPEFLASGDLTPRSDVYSFGIIVLRLLTGKAAFGINRAVQDAVDRGSLRDILDVSAGEWPYVQVEQLAHLGLRCCEITRRNRLDAAEAWRVIEPLMRSLDLPVPTTGLSVSSITPVSSTGLPAPYPSTGLPPLPLGLDFTI